MTFPRVAFVHVTKCGGTSVKAALRESSGPNKRGFVFDLDAAASTRTAVALDRSNWEIRDEMLRYLLESRDARVVMGHFRYTSALHGDFHEPWKMITVLRSPEERLLSLYFYNRFKDADYTKVREDLDEFLFSPPDGDLPHRRQVHAAFPVAMFRGDGRLPDELPTTADVDLATRNLERFAAVGILEDMDPFVASMETITGRPFELPVLNTSPARSGDRDVVDDRVLERVVEICAPARVLYERFGGAPL